MKKEKQDSLQDIMKERKILPVEKKQSIINNIFFNCILFMIMLILTLIINISYEKMGLNLFNNYIDVIQIFCAIISIAVLEVAFRKDSTKIGVYGIEVLMFSICVLFVPYMYISKFKLEFLKNIIVLFFIYYILKSFGILLYTRNSYLRRNISDVKEIVKEEKESYIDEESTKILKEQKIKEQKLKEKKAKEIKEKEAKLKEAKAKASKASKEKETKVKETKAKVSKEKEIKVKETKAKETNEKEPKVKETKTKETKTKESKAKEPKTKETKTKESKSKGSKTKAKKK